ncbi:hypothetical protein [Amycolatopsis magusensis]|uniref:hypothetical protein n=1 Tax=Amycolatopsis magusensis TaxID=882444 RepID=UPI003796EEE6
MVLFLVPIVAGAAAYGAATQDEAGSYSAGSGDRKIDCHQIWQQITTGEGPQSLAEGQAAAGRLKGNYESRITTINQLTAEMDAAWTGTSGAAAKSGGHPLKVWMQDSKDKLNDSDKYLGEQYNAFTTVHSKVQEVPKEPPQSGFINDIKPWETDTDRAIEEYNTKGQANVDAFNAYYKSSGDNGQGMPTYNAISGQVQAVDVNGDGTDGDGKDKDGNGSADQNGQGNDKGGYTPGNIPSANLPGGGSTPGGGYQPGNIPGAGTPGGGYNPGNIPGYNPGDLPGGSGGPGSPGYKPPSWDNGTGAAGYTPGKIPSAGGFGPGGSGGFGPGSGGEIPGADGFGPGGGGGGFGPGSGGNIGVGGIGAGGAGSGSGAGGIGAGGQSGAGAGAGKGMGMGGAMGGAAAAGAAGAGRGMGGGMGMGGMGAGGGRGGQGAEDEERQSRYLLGDDPNEVFGTDELTAPPVIGE